MTTRLRRRLSVRRLISVLILFTCIRGGYAQAPEITFHRGVAENEMNGVRRIIYANGIYATVTTSSPLRVFTSVNGTDWERNPGPPVGTNRNSAFTYGAGRWVIATDSGRIFSSTDLVSWTLSATNTHATFLDLAYFDSLFYAVGDSCAFYTSPDGLSWTRQTIGPVASQISYTNVLGGNGTILVEDFDNSLFVTNLHRSSGGVTGPWVIDSLGSNFPRFKYARGRFYWLNNRAENPILVSTDAQSWDTLAPLTGNNSGIYDVFTDTDKVYLLAEDKPQFGGGHNVLYPSTDGVTFDTLLSTNADGLAGSYAHGKYFISGPLSDIPALSVSSRPPLYTFVNGSYTSIASNGSNTVKIIPNRALGVIYNSTDFQHWTGVDTLPHAGLPQTWNWLSRVLYDSTRFLAVGTQTYSSTDGVSWTNLGATNVFTPVLNENFHATAGGPNKYAAFYYDGFDNRAYFSTDGVTWPLSTMPTRPDPIDPNLVAHITNIRWTNNRFFLTSDDEGAFYPNIARIFSSTDGSDFTTVAFANKWPAGFYVRAYDDIIYVPDSGKYYIFGTGNMPGQNLSFFCVSTTDPLDTSIVLNNMTTVSGIQPGADITDGAFYAGNGGLHFSYFKGHFVGAVHSNYNITGEPDDYISYLIWSSDGIHWDSQALGGPTDITSSYISGDTIRLAGTSNYTIQAIFASVTPPPADSILNFNAVSQGDTSVLLNWQTATEHDTRAFIIQRKINDGAGWERIGRVRAAGNSDMTTDYSFTDPSPVVGANHYRVRLRHTDSTAIQTSEVRTVRIRRHPHFNVFPNPASDHVTISGPAGVPGVITLYDAGGRARIRQNFSGSAITLPLGRLRTGVYRLVIQLRDDSQYEQQLLHIE